MRKLLKRVVAALVLFILCIAQFNFISYIHPVIAVTGEETSEIKMENNHYKYYYAQLSEQAKKIYDAMYEMYASGDLKKGNAKYDLVAHRKVSEDVVKAYQKGSNDLIIALETARDAFYLDYPEIFYINIEKYSIRITSDANGYHVWLGTGNNDSYYIHGISSEANVRETENKYEKAVKDIVDGAKAITVKDGENLKQAQITYVHEQVIKSAIYKLDDECDSINKGHIRTPYGALVQGQAVCEGFSKAMKVVLDKLDIPCILVRGVYQHKEANEAERHMWNYVQLDGKWYAVDATFDNTDKENQYNNEAVLTQYLLAGRTVMGFGHEPDTIMSAPEFEFKYPELEEKNYGTKQVANVDGLEIIYSTEKGTTGDSLSVFDISYKGMNFEDAEKAGYYMLVKYYMLNKARTDLVVDGWFYLGLDIYKGQITDYDNSFQINFANMEYVEFAVTDVPIDERVNSSDPFEARIYQHYQGKDEDLLAVSEVLECPDANYIAPPRFSSATPRIETKLKPGVTKHIKVTYDKDLKLIDANKEPSCSIMTKNAWTSSAKTNSKIENFQWHDDKRTVEFDFTPSDQYGDNSVIYYFNIENLASVDANKIPTPAYYYVQETFGCTYSMSQAKAWRAYGRPTLIDTGDIDVSNWTFDGEVSDEEITKLNSLTDRMALVVSPTTSEQETEMEKAIENENAIATQMYNINLVICNKNVLQTANGHKITVYLGFPEGYGPESAGVTFKAYHYKKTSTGLVAEEIDCVITPYGLLVTCDSFSPYAVAVVEADSNVQTRTKTLTITSSENGKISSEVTTSDGETKLLKTSIITLNEGDSVKCTVEPNEGYQIDSLVKLGNNIELSNKSARALSNDAYEMTIAYDDIEEENGMLDATFVAKTVAEYEEQNNQTVIVQEVEEPEITMPETVIANVGEKAVIRPEITSSNGVNVYRWYKNGVLLENQTKSVLTIENVKREDEGKYTLTVISTIDTVSKTTTSTECHLLTSDFEMELKSNKVSLLPGETFEVTAHLKNLRNINDGIVAITGKFEFDSSIIELYVPEGAKSAITGLDGWSLNTEGADIDEEAFYEQTLEFLADNSTLITNDSRIFTVKFKVKDTIVTDKTTTIRLTNVTASEGNGVISAVSNAQETVNIYNEEFTSEKYKIEENLITRIIPSTTVAEFRKNVTTKQEMTFTNPDGTVLKDTDFVTTNTVVKVGRTLSYTLCVIGDVDENGILDINDYARVKLHAIKRRKLEGICLTAADIDGDEIFTINDIARYKLVLIKRFVIK